MERKRAPFLGMQREIRTERDLAKREEGQMKSACVPNNRGEVVGVRRCLGGRGSSRLPGEAGRGGTYLFEVRSSSLGGRRLGLGGEAGGGALAGEIEAEHGQALGEGVAQPR